MDKFILIESKYGEENEVFRINVSDISFYYPLSRMDRHLLLIHFKGQSTTSEFSFKSRTDRDLKVEELDTVTKINVDTLLVD